MIKQYNNRSFLFGVPGILLQVVGNIMTRSPDLTSGRLLVGALIGLVGTVLLLIGFAYYAMAKGRSPVWCLAALLSCFGLIILALLKDKSGEMAVEWKGRTESPCTV